MKSNGIKRRASLFNTHRIDHLYEDPHKTERQFILHYGDLSDATNLIRIIQEVQPDELYSLAAQSHVKVSFETPEYTANVDALGTLRLLEAIRVLKLEGRTRFYQASTSELYGLVQEVPGSNGFCVFYFHYHFSHLTLMAVLLGGFRQDGVEGEAGIAYCFRL